MRCMFLRSERCTNLLVMRDYILKPIDRDLFVLIEVNFIGFGVSYIPGRARFVALAPSP